VPSLISSLLLLSFLIIKSLCRELILQISPLYGFMISTVQSDTTLQFYLGPICRYKSAYLWKALHLQKAFQTVTN